MTKQQIARGRAAERVVKDAYFKKVNQAPILPQQAKQQPSLPSSESLMDRLWATVKSWFST
jgi:hypothetical protein